MKLPITWSKLVHNLFSFNFNLTIFPFSNN